jgi:hypothetical protein
MATETLTAAMPALELTEHELLVLEAIDPTTGAAVAGVTVNNFVIYGRDLRDDNPAELTLEDVYLSPTGGDVIRPNPIPGRGD